jgi:hypothetical protein
MMENWAELSDDAVVNGTVSAITNCRNTGAFAVFGRQCFVFKGRNGSRRRFDRTAHTGYAAFRSRAGAR